MDGLLALRRAWSRLNSSRSRAYFERALLHYRAKDYAATVGPLLRASRLEHDRAQFYLAYLFESGKGVPVDHPRAASLYRRSASHGNVEAMFRLASKLQAGEGVARDADLAASGLRRAALGGSSVAQCHLGLAYLEGHWSFDVDEGAAARWLQKAADQGDLVACSALGFAYEFGKGVEKDLDASLSWQERSARGGSPLGQYRLALLYAHGIGVKADPEVALSWFSQAAEQQHPEAQFELAFCYLFAAGVERSVASAERWFRCAADQGHAQAAFCLKIVLADTAGLMLGNPLSNWFLRWTSGDPERRSTAWLDDQPRRVEFSANEAALSKEPIDRSLFSRQLCFFAFHLFPEWLFSSVKTAPEPTEAQLQAGVEACWREARHLECLVEGGPRWPAPTPICQRHTTVSNTFWLISLGNRLSAPEPTWLFFDTDRLEDGVQLAELSEGVCEIWGRVTAGGIHAMMGELSTADPGVMFDSFAKGLAHQCMTTTHPNLTFSHAMLYAETAHDFKQARKLRGDTVN